MIRNKLKVNNYLEMKDTLNKYRSIVTNYTPHRSCLLPGEKDKKIKVKHITHVPFSFFFTNRCIIFFTLLALCSLCYLRRSWLRPNFHSSMGWFLKRTVILLQKFSCKWLCNTLYRKQPQQPQTSLKQNCLLWQGEPLTRWASQWPGNQANDQVSEPLTRWAS